jgi:hypothetical protein
MTNKLKINFPVQGWEQLLTSRKEMLDAVDQSRSKSKSHKVKVFHGKNAESQYRAWLINFLPKRYGVTSGYIISPGIPSKEKTPHYDVIIYDVLESPILWIENNPDTSIQGHSRAIPAEYVKCVLEIKSQFTSKNANDALKHLKELLPLMSNLDDPQDRYKLYLPRNFCCGLVFFDLQEKNQFSKAALNKIVDGHCLRNFIGGIILRGENHKKSFTGRLTLGGWEEPFKSTVKRKGASLLTTAFSSTVKITDQYHIGVSLLWSEPSFAQFGFDIISMMQGTYESGKLSSFYGMGSSC